jgi:zinc D-Ala-D-Ala carboxypeptidase
MKITEHFTLAEAEHSDTAKKNGIDNTIPEHLKPNLIRMCNFMEEVRSLFNLPIKITSFYRCEELNKLVGGSPNSAHKDCRACDFSVHGKFPHTIFDALRDSDLQFDQLILESSSSGSIWIHLAIAREGEKPRRNIMYGSKTKDGSIFRVANG